MAACSQAGQTKSLTLGKVLRTALPLLAETYRLPTHHWKTLRAIAACQTEALGGHRYRCTHCGTELFVPHSCGNRHCPTCHQLESAQWLEHQLEHLLPVPYFHVVFTLPHDFNPLIQYNQPLIYNLLFTSATATLLEFGRKNLKATLGITAVLHTWSQNLLDHYHLHCVVTGGGLSLDGQSWVACSPQWLFPVQALSQVFRAKFRDGLLKLSAKNELRSPDSQPTLGHTPTFVRWLHQVCRPHWVVYAKRPFADAKAVLAYVCRYTHRVAITNRRIKALDPENRTVTFSYKDYAQGSQIRSMTLPLEEFVRRFCLHILPERFVKIRHYGLLSNRGRAIHIAQARSLLTQVVPAAVQRAFEQSLTIEPVEVPPLVCPTCGRATLEVIEVVDRPETLPTFDDSS